MLDSTDTRPALRQIQRLTWSPMAADPVFTPGSWVITTTGTLTGFPNVGGPPSATFAKAKGVKQYELTNHLGNVLMTVSDLKGGQEEGTADGIADYYYPEVLWTGDYYQGACPDETSSVGSMIAREWSADDYRYGFNGQEQEDEIVGDGNAYSFNYRIHDTRLGRFMSVDPLAHGYPWYSTYQFSGNTPIMAVELEGLEPAEIVQNNRYTPAAAEFLSIISKVDKEDISNQLIISRELNFFLRAPWYSAKNGGGAMTTGNYIIFTENYFDNTGKYGSMSYGYSNSTSLRRWLRLSSHEVRHLTQWEFFGNDF